VRDIHHRMPVILNPDVYEFWLNPENQDVTALKNILAKAFLADLVSHPVSKKVNSTRNNGASCIDPVD
jgi:putative SOS response-associated peptidase YedK